MLDVRTARGSQNTSDSSGLGFGSVCVRFAGFLGQKPVLSGDSLLYGEGSMPEAVAKKCNPSFLQEGRLVRNQAPLLAGMLEVLWKKQI